MVRRNAAEEQGGEGTARGKRVKRSEEESGIERRLTRAALAAITSSSEGKAEAPTSSQQTPGNDQDPCTSAATSKVKNLSEKRARLRRKKMRGKPSAAVVDKNAEGVTRIKRQVKYFVNNMNMEQNMIDAYSNEGWKGNNREKVRPVNELQKATAKIARYKLKIREAMQELDTMCKEGSILESAFDDDGQLDYQEIFCCKCHSHDTEADNDIILCDGKCTRGFHQKCLVPPLATEEIPPGDEGWLCPVCDCKSDCVSLLNDHLETNFEVETAWEAFFPEAVPDVNNAAAENLPSDESDDDDYDPNNKKDDEGEAANADGDGQPEEKKEPQAEDADDDDEDDGDDDDENGEEDGDGDSDSDDVSTDLEGEEPFSGAEDDEVNQDNKEDDGKEDAGVDKVKDDEEAKQDEKEKIDERSRRKRKEVDYKKLHDEMFGWGEYWEDEAAQSADEDYGTEKKPRKRSEAASKSKKPKKISKKDEANNSNSKATDEPRNKASKKTSSREPNTVSRKNSSYERIKASSHKHTDVTATDPRRLPSEAVKKLRRAFEENQLPTKSFKEKLSKELGLPYKKVDTWFKNFRTQALKSGLSQPIRPCPWKLKQAQEDAETNKLLTLLEKVQFKLHDMRKTMEAVQVPQVLRLPSSVNGFENSVIDVNRRKRVIYKPVAAEVVEKAPANNRKNN